MANSKKKVGTIKQTTTENTEELVPTVEVSEKETPVEVSEKETPKKEKKSSPKTIEGHDILIIDKVNGMFDIKTVDGLRFIISKEEFDLNVK